jgi:two-component sensor histidine kinase
LWRSAFAAATLAGLLGLTALVARQARREAMLMGEIEHRFKNVLAVSMRSLTALASKRSRPLTFCRRFAAAFSRFADTQSLFSRSQWKGVSLGDLIGAELEPYATRDNTRIEGPMIHLMPNASHAPRWRW